MKAAPLFPRHFLLAGLAASALLCASGASAQNAAPYYSFEVDNLTSSNGDPVFPVYDSVTFDAVQINEVFADNFTQSILLGDLETQDFVQTSAQYLTPGSGVFTDPIHGGLTSAVVTGTLAFPGIPPDGSGKLDLTIQPTTDPNSQYEQSVFTPFSASLFGPNPTGIGLGTFSLLNSSNQTVESVNIEAAAAPVPEASTTVSLGLLLALGLGSLVVTRRKSRTAGHA